MIVEFEIEEDENETHYGKAKIVSNDGYKMVTTLKTDDAIYVNTYRRMAIWQLKNVDRTKIVVQQSSSTQHNIRPMSERERPVLELVGEIDVFTILARTRQAMRKAGWSAEEIAEVTLDMVSDDNDHLVDVVYALCDVE